MILATNMSLSICLSFLNVETQNAAVLVLARIEEARGNVFTIAKSMDTEPMISFCLTVKRLVLDLRRFMPILKLSHIQKQYP